MLTAESYAKPDEIGNFNENAELAKRKLRMKKVEKALITQEKHPSVAKLCDKFGILVGELTTRLYRLYILGTS